MRRSEHSGNPPSPSSNPYILVAQDFSISWNIIPMGKARYEGLLHPTRGYKLTVWFI
jgi:hypothetical protein